MTLGIRLVTVQTVVGNVPVVCCVYRDIGWAYDLVFEQVFCYKPIPSRTAIRVPVYIGQKKTGKAVLMVQAIILVPTLAVLPSHPATPQRNRDFN